MIYGYNNKKAVEARTFKNGMLNTTHRYGQLWLLNSTNPKMDCEGVENPKVCYRTSKKIRLVNLS